jgi:TolB-like protein
MLLRKYRIQFVGVTGKMKKNVEKWRIAGRLIDAHYAAAKVTNDN